MQKSNLKLILSDWLIRELECYEAQYQIITNDFITNSVKEYLDDCEIDTNDIIKSNRNKSEIIVEMPVQVAEQLQATAKLLSVDCSDIVFTALAFTAPNLMSAIETEEILNKGDEYYV